MEKTVITIIRSISWVPTLDILGPWDKVGEESPAECRPQPSAPHIIGHYDEGRVSIKNACILVIPHATTATQAVELLKVLTQRCNLWLSCENIISSFLVCLRTLSLLIRSLVYSSGFNIVLCFIACALGFNQITLLYVMRR